MLGFDSNKQDLRLDTKLEKIKFIQDLPCDVKEEESPPNSTESQTFLDSNGLSEHALFCAKNDVESPLTELKRAFDMLQSSSFFIDESKWEKDQKDDVKSTKNDEKESSIDESSSSFVYQNTNRFSRLQKSRPASLSIPDFTKTDHRSIIRTPSVPPTTLTFPSSINTPLEGEPKSALLPFYLDKERYERRSSPHVHFSDQFETIQNISNSSNNFYSLNDDNIVEDTQSSPAFENPFCFENANSSSCCSSDESLLDLNLDQRNSKRMNSFQSEISIVSSCISIESEDILTAPPTLERVWHRGIRGGEGNEKGDQLKGNSLRLPSTFNTNIPSSSSSSKKYFLNRGGMRSASATASSTFKNAIQSFNFKRNASFQDSKGTRKSNEKEIQIVQSQDNQEGLGILDFGSTIPNYSNAKMFGMAIGNHQESTSNSLQLPKNQRHASTKQRKHPSKSPYPINVSKMPNSSSSPPPPSSATSSASHHFQSPMMASYFATLG